MKITLQERDIIIEELKAQNLKITQNFEKLNLDILGKLESFQCGNRDPCPDHNENLKDIQNSIYLLKEEMVCLREENCRLLNEKQCHPAPVSIPDICLNPQIIGKRLTYIIYRKDLSFKRSLLSFDIEYLLQYREFII